MVYKYCLVPYCTSTTVSTPNKTFMKVPFEYNKRRTWLKAAGRDPKELSIKTTCFVCEDHFNLEQDLKNFMEWKNMGVRKRLKQDVVPHKFDCQKDRKHDSENRNVSKQIKIEILKNSLCDRPTENLSICDWQLMKEEDGNESLSVEDTLLDRYKISREAHKFVSKGIQVQYKPKFRSKSTQCSIPTTSTCRSSSPIKTSTVNITLSPIKISFSGKEKPYSSKSYPSGSKTNKSSPSIASGDSNFYEMVD
nr:uncharacterized protein LOC111517058 [Leptinotarsa decemlineata]